ncbi:DUF861 domain-containing protein [Cryobacterium sp. Sr8]|uniref:cupin domain-containing protein n=1 Tax=Cryobacterium sp. Sr8 TaxID=1259203 RepID=UPI00106BDD04|nr:cupin domain-containing protein [Cryobacterium sp. Sr8]TFD74562.1 DUF861 domain-containing protein [Cryobacterium sp. Sr8]
MLTPGHATAAAALRIERAPVPAAQVVAGTPGTGSAVLDVLGDTEIGVWEMSPGAMRDVEVDEVFLVLSGAATVDFEGDGRRITLAPGDIVRLVTGMRTVWTVTETLRKLYLA